MSLQHCSESCVFSRVHSHHWSQRVSNAFSPLTPFLTEKPTSTRGRALWNYRMLELPCPRPSQAPRCLLRHQPAHPHPASRGETGREERPRAVLANFFRVSLSCCFVMHLHTSHEPGLSCMAHLTTWEPGKAAFILSGMHLARDSIITEKRKNGDWENERREPLLDPHSPL